MSTGCKRGACFAMGALSTPLMPLLVLHSFPTLPCTAPHHRGLTRKPAFPGPWSPGLLLGSANLRHLEDKDRREGDFPPILLTVSIISSSSCVSSIPLLILDWVHLTSTSDSWPRSTNTMWSIGSSQFASCLQNLSLRAPLLQKLLPRPQGRS